MTNSPTEWDTPEIVRRARLAVAWGTRANPRAEALELLAALGILPGCNPFDSTSKLPSLKERGCTPTDKTQSYIP